MRDITHKGCADFHMKETCVICVLEIMQSLDVNFIVVFLISKFLLADETCTDCSKDSLYYVKFIGFFALRIGAVCYSIKVNLNKVSGAKKKKEGEKKEKRSISNEDFQSNLMKIVVNFLQVSTIIFQYRFDWPDFVIYYFVLLIKLIFRL